MSQYVFFRIEREAVRRIWMLAECLAPVWATVFFRSWQSVSRGYSRPNAFAEDRAKIAENVILMFISFFVQSKRRGDEDMPDIQNTAQKCDLFNRSEAMNLSLSRSITDADYEI